MPQMSITDPATGIQSFVEITEDQQELILELLRREPPQERISDSRINEIIKQAINDRLAQGK